VSWTKTSDDFPDDCYRDALSDAAYRTRHEGLSWSNRHLLDGWLPKRDLRRFAFTSDPQAAVAELVARGYWNDEGDAWRIVHHLEHQPSRDQVLRRRAVDAERQDRYRESKLRDAEQRHQSQRQSRQESRRYVTRDPGRDGSGRDGEVTKTSHDENRTHAYARESGDSGHCEVCGNAVAAEDGRVQKHYADRQAAKWGAEPCDGSGRALVATEPYGPVGDDSGSADHQSKEEEVNHERDTEPPPEQSCADCGRIDAPQLLGCADGRVRCRRCWALHREAS
jgi:hypothetical protein